MPSQLSGLIAALSKGAQGYQLGTDDAEQKRLADEARAQQRAIQLHAQQRQDAMDAEKMAMDRATAFAKGIDMGGTAVHIAPPAPAPVAPVFDPSALSAGASSPSALVRPVDLGGVPKVAVTQEGPSYNPENDRSLEAINARSTAAMDRLTQTLDSRETEGAANRGMRTSEGAANRGSREGIAARGVASRESIAAKAVEARTTLKQEVGAAPVTGAARLGAIVRHAGRLEDGGMDPKIALATAEQDVDNLNKHFEATRRKPAPMAPSGATPPPSSPAPAAHDTPPPVAKIADPAVALAVKQIQSGKATLAQLEASGKSAAYKAAVKAALGTP